MVAPALHSISDAIEWAQRGFSAPQLWLNYAAFLPMPGLLLGASALRAGWLPRGAVLLFLAGLVVNALLGLLAAPEIFQTLGSAMRNLGLMAMGHAVLVKRR